MLSAHEGNKVKTAVTQTGMIAVDVIERGYWSILFHHNLFACSVRVADDVDPFRRVAIGLPSSMKDWLSVEMPMLWAVVVMPVTSFCVHFTL